MVIQFEIDSSSTKSKSSEKSSSSEKGLRSEKIRFDFTT